MSCDDDYPPPARCTPLRWLIDRWWGFVIWAALDAPWQRLNDWGLRRLSGPKPRATSNKLLERASRERCSICDQPYERDPTGMAALCSSGFHVCRDCTWVNGRLTARCAHHDAEES